MTSSKKSISQSIWDFFCSLKLTMFTLITLAIISIIGTIIPQGSPPPEYLQTISPAKLKLYQSLGFFNMYHSWWFIHNVENHTLRVWSCGLAMPVPYGSG